MKNTALTVVHRWTSFEHLLDTVRDEPAFPGQVTVQWLRAQGFNRPGDPNLLNTLRTLGFLDRRNRPTPRWANFHLDPHDTLLTALGEHYPGLVGSTAWPLPHHATIDAWFQPPRTSRHVSNQQRAKRVFTSLSKITDRAAHSNLALTAPNFLRPPVTGTIRTPIVLQLPVLTSREQYVVLLSAIRDVFYT